MAPAPTGTRTAGGLPDQDGPVLRLSERLRGLGDARRRGVPSNGPPPCVGCRGDRIDQLGPVEIGDLSPATPGSMIAPVEGVQAAVVGDHLVVLDPVTGHRVLLNASAALVFTAIDQRRSAADVVDQLASETAMAAAAIEPDVLGTLDRLVAQGLVAREDLVADDAGGGSVAAGRTAARPGDAVEATRGRRWAFDSGVRVGAGVPVVVRAEPASVVGDLEAALAALPPSGPDRLDEHTDMVRLDLVSDPPGDDDPAHVRVVVHATGQQGDVPASDAVSALFDQLDAELAETAPGLRLHAGAVERAGRVVVVLGESGRGKSTLTAALVQAGWRYLTDELTVIDPGTFRVAAYARPLDLDRTSLETLGITRPDLTTHTRKAKVHPFSLGPTSTGGRIAAIVVLPAGASEGDALVTELPAHEAVMTLLSLTFAATFDDADALEQLARLCSTTPTIRLHRGPLEAMVEAVEAAVAQPGHLGD